jgi:hypothetical protein
MTKEEKDWFENGKFVGETNSNQHPEQLIQEEWLWDTLESFEDRFPFFLDNFSAWASGVRKGSKYFENH